MKTEREIREKIDSLMNSIKKAKVSNMGKIKKASYVEQMCAQIDILLWMLGDQSGLPPVDERIDEAIKMFETKG